MSCEIAELPDVETGSSFPTPGLPAFEELCAKLFSSPTLLIRKGPLPVVFRNEDLRAISALPGVGAPSPAFFDKTSFTFSDATGRIFANSLSELIGNQFISANPPIHGPVRKVLAPHLMPRSVAHLEPVAARIAAEVAGELSAADEFEFCETFAAPLAARFFGEFLGMTSAEIDQVAQHIYDLSPMFLRDKSAAELTAADRASRAYIDLIISVVERGLSSNRRSLFHEMATELAAIQLPSDPNSHGIVPSSLGLLLAANLMDAFHTAGVAAATTVFMLLMHPHYCEKVRADKTLVRPAVHEALRLLSPLTVTLKVALHPIEFGGVRIPADTPIVMLWAVGNRDPSCFETPNDYKLERSHRFESTFGGGAHICPGRFVADMVSQVTVREVLKHDWTLAAHPEFIGRSILSQVRSLRIRSQRTH